MVQITTRPNPGEVFVPMHYLEGGANNLTKEDPLDGAARTPEFKVTDVQITKVGTGDEAPAGTVPRGDTGPPVSSDD